MDLTNLYNIKIQRLQMELEFEVSFFFCKSRNSFSIKCFFLERKITKTGLRKMGYREQTFRRKIISSF